MMPYKDPAKMAEYMRNRRMKIKNQVVNDKVNVNPVNPQNVNEGKKNDILRFGPCEIQLTWGPDTEGDSK